MAENSIINNAKSIFDGMDNFISTKTVVGEPVKAGDAVIIPLVDVTCGMAVGSYGENSKNSGGGGMSAKISPAAVLIVQNGLTKVVPIKNQDALSKALDMIPDIMSKITGNNKKISPEAVEKAIKLAEEAEEKAKKNK